MVKKLIKHEFRALLRTILPAAGILLALAVLSGLSTHLNYQQGDVRELFQQLAQTMLVGLFLVAIGVIFILTYVVCIKRFYDSMYSKQGYLTMALPVDPMKLLFSKLVSAVVVLAFSVLVAIVAGLLFFAVAGVNLGAFFYEVGQLISTIIGLELFEVGHVVLFILAILAGAIAQLLFFYACISATQLVTSHRGIIGVAIYIGAGQIWGSLSSMITSLITLFWEADGGVSVDQMNLFLYVQLIIPLAFSVALGVGCVFFIRYILRNKVNIIA